MKQVTLGGQRFNVSRNEKGVCFIGSETSDAFVERMSLLGRKDIISDLAALGEAKSRRGQRIDSVKSTPWSLHQNKK